MFTRIVARKSVGIGLVLAVVSSLAVFGLSVTSASAAECSAVHFIGARGSGEAQGFGPTIAATLREFQTRATASVSSYALVYPAVHQPIGDGATIIEFSKSVDAGTANLTKYLAAQVQACPSQKLVLAGYSQGALVVGRALAASPSTVLAHVVAVTQFGDPRFELQFAGNVGNYDRRYGGLVKFLLPKYGGTAYLPTAVAPNAQSYCLFRDPVCNYSIFNVARCFWSIDGKVCPHTKYEANGYTTRAGEYLAGKVN